MNAPARPEGSRQTDHVQERGGNPGVDTVPQEPRSDEQAPPWGAPESNVPDEGAFETFVGGAGI
jgi:hypothetical protein